MKNNILGVTPRPISILETVGNIWRICITGGPCGGKTTAMAKLIELLVSRGYKVLVSPESATKLILAGVNPALLSNIDFQEEILLDTIAQENRMVTAAMKLAAQGHKVVILYDRGTLDGEAYCEPGVFAQLLDRHSYDYAELCHHNYHGVIHLRTAALGAEAFYTLENNKARVEKTLEEARDVDERTLRAWQRHFKVRVVDNSTAFDEKIQRVLREVCSIIGEPEPVELEDKYLLEPTTLADLVGVTYTVSDIVQDYLVSPNAEEEHRVRRRSQDDVTIYFHTVKRYISPGKQGEVDKLIDWHTYGNLLQMRDPVAQAIHKKRVCFFWKDKPFELDLFEGRHAGLCLLENERATDGEKNELPPFLKVVRKVTGEREYSNGYLARN